MSDPNHTQSQVTALLNNVDMTDADKQNQLLDLIYLEMRRMAQMQMSHERANHTLSPTALVHEAYLRLMNDQAATWDSKRHFYAAVGRAMRRILVESARAKYSQKRGGQWQHTSRIDVPTAGGMGDDMLALDQALSALEAKDKVMAEVVNLRYFSGLSVQEVAQTMDLSPRSINRQWTAARAWLIMQMQ